MVVAPLVSLPSACSCELSFWPIQDPFVERMQQHTSLSPLHLPSPCSSSWAQACWYQGSLHTGEAWWHSSHSQNLSFKLRNQEEVQSSEKLCFTVICCPSSEGKGTRKMPFVKKIAPSWKRFRLLFLSQRNPSLLIKITITFLCFWFFVQYMHKLLAPALIWPLLKDLS